MQRLSAVVVGGGVTGLALAHRLLVLGGGRIAVTVLEGQARTGGWVRSSLGGGVLMEDGPRSLRVPGNGATTLKLLHELRLLDQVLPAAPAAKVRYVWFRGKRQLVPTSLSGMPGNPLAMPLIAGGVLEPFQNRRFLKGEPDGEGTDFPDESIHSFFSRRMGRFFADKIATALVSGVWAGDARRLSVRSCMPALFESERTHGSLVLGGLFGGGNKTRVDPAIERAMKCAVKTRVP